MTEALPHFEFRPTLALEVMSRIDSTGFRVIIMIETLGGLENAGKIAALPGVHPMAEMLTASLNIPLQ